MHVHEIRETTWWTFFKIEMMIADFNIVGTLEEDIDKLKLKESGIYHCYELTSII